MIIINIHIQKAVFINLFCMFSMLTLCVEESLKILFFSL